jgi:hypothetical protein
LVPLHTLFQSKIYLSAPAKKKVRNKPKTFRFFNPASPHRHVDPPSPYLLMQPDNRAEPPKPKSKPLGPTRPKHGSLDSHPSKGCAYMYIHTKVPSPAWAPTVVLLLYLCSLAPGHPTTSFPSRRRSNNPINRKRAIRFDGVRPRRGALQHDQRVSHMYMYMYITERLSVWELFLPCVPYYQGRRTSPRQAAPAIVVFGGVQDVGGSWACV